MTEDVSGHLLDVNVLLALNAQDHPHFEAAHRWFEARTPGAFWATSPITEASFVRLMMLPSVAGTRHSAATVLDKLKRMWEMPGHTFLADPTSVSHSNLDLRALVGPKQVTDFHLVNLAVASNAVLATFDRRLRDALAPSDQRFVELVPV